MRLAPSLYALALVCAPAVAGAEPEQRPTATLTHTREAGAESCPDEQELKDAVSGRLGYLPFEATAPRRISVSFGKAGGKLVATLVVEREDAPPKTRELESAPGDCLELAQSVALAISVAIDPLGGTRPAEPEPAAEPATELAAEPLPPPAPPAPTTFAAAPAPDEKGTPIVPAAADLEPAPSWRVDLLTAGRAAYGELPQFSPGFVWGLGLRRQSLAISLWADIALDVEDETPEGAYEASLWGGTLRGCWHKDPLYLCALGRAGRLSASGLKVDRPNSEEALLGSAGLGAGVRFRLLWNIDALLGVDALANLSRVTLTLDATKIWDQPPAAVAGYVALAAIP